MAESFQLHVVTPVGEIVDADVVELIAPGVDGQFGILPRHARYMTALGVGELHYTTTDGAKEILAVAGGFAEVSKDRVSVLAQTAEDATRIDVARAEASLQRAEARLKEPEEGSDVGRATIAMEKSLARLRVAKARGIKPTHQPIVTHEMPIPGADDE
ncbi:MAG: F0F1 ATP synthase subunit epsilon [Acidobacteria bacterium]|nr:F0F1 ATP synthase subunit epsilon [Acidobacteriota bacterium]